MESPNWLNENSKAFESGIPSIVDQPEQTMKIIGYTSPLPGKFGKFHHVRLHPRIEYIHSLVFQIPWVCRCLDPETPPEARPLGGPFTPILTRYDWGILEDDRDWNVPPQHP